MGDLISRQAAIDALDQIFDRCEEIEAHLPEGDPDRTGYKMYPDYMTVWKYLHQLPSAQPEKVCIANITLSEEQIREAVEKAKNEVVRELPSAQPTADVVEVVRCKDCKYNAKGDNESEFWNICTLRPRLYVPVSDEDYCSRGETKDE